MTTPQDTLGRAPIMRPMLDVPADPHPCEDWRGESIIRNVERKSNTLSAAQYAARVQIRVMAAKRPAQKATFGECAHAGCSNGLSRQNKAGVCKDHTHGPFCACPPCANRAKRGRK